jgi:tellurite resistance protein
MIGMEEPHAAGELTMDKRVDYLVAVASIVYADGRATTDELAVLGMLCSVLDLTPRGVDVVVAAARNPDPARVAEIVAGLEGDRLKHALLTDAILVAFADGRVAYEETREIAEFARAVGIGTAQATLIGRYVEEIIVAADGHDLSRALAEGLAEANAQLHPPRGVRWLYRKLVSAREGHLKK